MASAEGALMFFGLFAKKAPWRVCDVPGCGATAPIRSTGAEVDTSGQLRTATAKLNVCGHHRDWIFSEDARAAAERNPNVYNSRT